MRAFILHGKQDLRRGKFTTPQDVPDPALLTKLESAGQIARTETWKRVPSTKK